MYMYRMYINNEIKAIHYSLLNPLLPQIYCTCMLKWPGHWMSELRNLKKYFNKIFSIYTFTVVNLSFITKKINPQNNLQVDLFLDHTE